MFHPVKENLKIFVKTFQQNDKYIAICKFFMENN